MADQDPATPSVGVDQTIEQSTPRVESDAGLDATQAASPSALAETQAEDVSLAQGSNPRTTPGALTSSGLREGTRIGRFLVTGELGAGGMGVVYAAYDPKLERKVAIKMLHEGIGKSHRARLEREARAMAKLSHPNVVSVYEVGDFKNRLFVAMEFIEGKTLRDWLAKEKPDKKEIMRVMIEAGQGLAAAHDEGMAHRDFKPDNILVGTDGRAKVSDFGLVTPVGQDTIDEAAPVDTKLPLSMSALTVVGTIMGTPLYMAPEQHRGEPADHRADQFSFCVTLWEALYENTPYSAKSYEALVDNVTAGRIQEPSRASRGPAWIRAILARGLSVKPGERYESMDDLLGALELDPWMRRRRHVAVVGIGGLLGAAALVLAFGGGEDRAAVCRGADTLVADLWNPQVRSQVAASFAASEVQGATSSWQGVAPKLDDYATSWVALRTQSCEATHLHQEQSEILLGYSMDCFDRRLLGFASLVSLFASDPNEQVVTKAETTADGLAGLRSCLNRSELERSVPMPEDPERRALLIKLQSDFEEVRNLDRRGDYASALAKNTEIVEQLKEVDYAPFAAEVLVSQGSFQQTLGDTDSAETTFRAAASAASRARDDNRVAQVWIRVLDVLAAQGRYDEALAMEAVAITSAERVPEELGTQARLNNTLGGIYVAKGRYPDAFAVYEKALALQYKIGVDGNMALAPAIANLGLAKWYTNDIAGAQESFDEALALMLKDLGPDHPQVGYIRKNLADLCVMLNESAAAKEHLLEVVRIWKATLGEEHANLAYAYEHLAKLTQAEGNREAAFDYIDKAISLRENSLGANHPLTVQAYSVAIFVYLKEGTPESLKRAEETLASTLATVESLGEAGLSQAAYVYDSRAELAEKREQWRDALADRERALELRVQTLGESSVDTAFSYSKVAGLSSRMKRSLRAESYFQRAQDIYDANPGFGDQDAVQVRRSRAILRLQDKDHASARALFEEALQRALVGQETASLVPLLRFDLVKLRLDSEDRDAVLAETTELRASLELPAFAELAKEMDAWLAGK